MAKKKPNEEPQSNSEPSADESKLDETLRMDTVRIDQDPGATIEVDPSQKTVVDGADDLTVQIDQSGSIAGGNVSVYRGQGSAGQGDEAGKTAADWQVDTTVNIQPSDDRKAVVADASIMVSSEISQTINPRELSDQDVAAWNAEVGDGSKADETERSGVESSYAEQQLGKLRRVDVASLKSDTDAAFDYRLVRKLGEGGMGDVFVARQGSLDRLLALKLIKPLSGKKREQLEKTGRLDSFEEERRQQFLSEAIVTGDLDHPNIVPIHDVGLTSDNQLFYAMKRVLGTPWSEVINEKSRDENLEILLKASDAIGFAHTRGVVHRDIKPENIMLGDFGVVMVMDWGLALLTSESEKQESITTTSGLGGTPAFMAPEMATGPLDKIGVSSDIYLFGATLFLIITGKPPHTAKNVTECIRAVCMNQIREVPSQQQGELLDIAMKAMATNPQDRYPNVESFQKAIREYRSHAESISLATRAAEDLSRGKQSQSYADLSRAAFGFEESIESWAGNENARRGLAETKIVHANAAYNSGDYDLGLSLLDQQNPEHATLIQKLREGVRERESRAARLSLMRKVAAAMLAFIIVGGSVAMYTINREKQLAETARDSAVAANAEAEEARQRAVKAYKIAENERVFAEINEQEARLQKQEADSQRARAVAERTEAQKQKEIAELQRSKAVAAKRDADDARQRAVYEEYVSKIGLAKARLERNEVDGAREILRQIKAGSPTAAESWEYRWLWRQTNQAESSRAAAAPIIDLSIGRSGRSGVVALSNGQVQRLAIDQQGMIAAVKLIQTEFLDNRRATSVAISADEKRIAIGSASGQILVLGDGSETILRGHIGRVSDLQFTDDGVLVSGSQDKTVRLWDAAAGRELTKRQACWHISPVRQLAVAGNSKSLTLAVAIADEKSGRIELWNLRRQGDSMTLKRSGTFDQHSQRPTTVSIAPDGQRVASGDVGGNLFVWQVSDAVSTDYVKALRTAVNGIQNDASATGDQAGEPPHNARSVRLVDTAASAARRLISTASVQSRDPSAHGDQIRSIRFNSTGTALLTASDDYTLKLWDLASRSLRKTLKGHGGWVVAAEFLPGQADLVLSASNDATVRSWNPQTYVGSFVSDSSADGTDNNDKAEAHRDEIWSAALSPDGTHIVTASRDHTARVLRIDPRTLAFNEVTRLEDELLQEGSEFVAMSMQLDRNHNRLYVGSADAAIRVWDLDRGVQIGRAADTGLNTAFAVSKDGQLMLTGSSDAEVKAILWRLDPSGNSSPRLLHRLKGHDQAVTAFAISADARRIFTADRDGRGILWDAKTGQPIGRPIDQLRGYRINAAHFSPAGNELLLAADDEHLTRIDMESRQLIARMMHDGVVTQLSVSSDGRYGLTLSELSTTNGASTAATLWDLETGLGSVLDRTAGNRDRQQPITSVRFDPSGKFASISRAAASNSPSLIQLYQVSGDGGLDDTELAAPAAGLGQPGRQPGRVSLANEATRLVSTDSHPASTFRALAKKSFRLPAVLGTAQVALPIDEHSMLTLNKNGVFRWNFDSKQLVTSYRPHAALTEASFSYDGKRIATGSRSVKIWDAKTGKPLGKIEAPHAGPVRTIQFAPTPGGETEYLFATGGADQMVRLWSWNDSTNQIKQLQEYNVQVADATIRRVRFSPDGERLLVVGDNGIARIWDLKQQAEPIVFDSADAGDFTCGAFSSDGSVIAVGSSDQRVRLWRVPEPAADPVVLAGHADVVNDVKLIGQVGSNLRVLSASADDTARVWDPQLATQVDGDRAGRELLSLRRHSGDVTAIDATENGDLVMTAGRDGTVILWPAGG